MNSYLVLNLKRPVVQRETRQKENKNTSKTHYIKQLYTEQHTVQTPAVE